MRRFVGIVWGLALLLMAPSLSAQEFDPASLKFKAAWDEMMVNSDALIDCALKAVPPLAATRDIPAADAAAAAVDGCDKEQLALDLQIKLVWRMSGMSYEEAEKQVESNRTSLIRLIAAEIVKIRARTR